MPKRVSLTSGASSLGVKTIRGQLYAQDHLALTTSVGSTVCSAFQELKPPLRAAASKPFLFSLRAARTLVASSGQVQ